MRVFAIERRWIMGKYVLLFVVSVFLFSPSFCFAGVNGMINKADTAWMLVSAALVLLMTPYAPTVPHMVFMLF